jgi:membrane-associated protease RseP (regulator of RpoE activity)
MAWAYRNPFSRFYQSALDTQRGPAFIGVELFEGQPTIIEEASPDQSAIAMFEKGYVDIGYANFFGPAFDLDLAKAQARKVKAEVVTVARRYLGTAQGTMPFVVPNPATTTTTNYYGQVWGPRGVAPYSGTAYTTAPGGYSTYQIPYSVDKYEYYSRFWLKSRTRLLGVWGVDLTQESQRVLERNKGVFVIAVAKNSPAFEANVLPGDVIIKMDGKEVVDGKHFNEMVEMRAGQQAVLTVLRPGQEKDIPVKLNALPESIRQDTKAK